MASVNFSDANQKAATVSNNAATGMLDAYKSYLDMSRTSTRIESMENQLEQQENEKAQKETLKNYVFDPTSISTVKGTTEANAANAAALDTSAKQNYVNAKVAANDKATNEYNTDWFGMKKYMPSFIAEKPTYDPSTEKYDDQKLMGTSRAQAGANLFATDKSYADARGHLSSEAVKSKIISDLTSQGVDANKAIAMAEAKASTYDTDAQQDKKRTSGLLMDAYKNNKNFDKLTELKNVMANNADDYDASAVKDVDGLQNSLALGNYEAAIRAKDKGAIEKWGNLIGGDQKAKADHTFKAEVQQDIANANSNKLSELSIKNQERIAEDNKAEAIFHSMYNDAVNSGKTGKDLWADLTAKSKGNAGLERVVNKAQSNYTSGLQQANSTQRLKDAEELKMLEKTIASEEELVKNPGNYTKQIDKSVGSVSKNAKELFNIPDATYKSLRQGDIDKLQLVYDQTKLLPIDQVRPMLGNVVKEGGILNWLTLNPASKLEVNDDLFKGLIKSDDKGNVNLTGALADLKTKYDESFAKNENISSESVVDPEKHHSAVLQLAVNKSRRDVLNKLLLPDSKK